MDNTLKILQYAMTMEKQGQQFYLKYKDEIEGKRFKETFENLAKVEEEHYHLLKEQYEIFKAHGKFEALDIQLDKGDKIFEKALKTEQSMLDPETDYSLNNMAILRMAYLIENDFAEFYRSAVEKTTSPEAKRLLSILAEWENNHRKMFYKDYQELMEANWGEQRFAPF